MTEYRAQGITETLQDNRSATITPIPTPSDDNAVLWCVGLVSILAWPGRILENRENVDFTASFRMTEYRAQGITETLQDNRSATITPIPTPSDDNAVLWCVGLVSILAWPGRTLENRENVDFAAPYRMTPNVAQKASQNPCKMVDWPSQRLSRCQATIMQHFGASDWSAFWPGLDVSGEERKKCRSGQPLTKG